jgi:hypothetical protein
MSEIGTLTLAMAIAPGWLTRPRARERGGAGRHDIPLSLAPVPKLQGRLRDLLQVMPIATQRTPVLLRRG